MTKKQWDALPAWQQHLRAQAGDRPATAFETAQGRAWAIIIGAVFMVAVLGWGHAQADELQCGENEVLVPAVTHTEEVTSCEFKGNWTFGLNSQCNGQWQFRQSAYHEVTEEVEVVDEPAFCQAVEPEPVDMCPNIEGDQASVPEGKEIVEGQCVDVTPTPEPEDNGGGSEETPKQSTSGGGGFTFCDLNTEPTSNIRDIHMCTDRDTGKVVQTLSWRAAHGDASGQVQLQIILLQKAVSLLKQMIGLLQ